MHQRQSSMKSAMKRKQQSVVKTQILLYSHYYRLTGNRLSCHVALLNEFKCLLRSVSG